jgi:hypothetical protein
MRAFESIVFHIIGVGVGVGVDIGVSVVTLTVVCELVFPQLFCAMTA